MIEASVVICAYTFDRWDQLKDAVASVRAQSRPPREIVIVVDGNEELLRRAAREIEGVTVVPNTQAKGLCGGRMTGADLATAPVIAFLDDDAIADPDWLEKLLEAYRDEHVLGAGGYIEPLWSGPPPAWFPPEFNWVVGCTYAGMPVRDGYVRNMIGASMSVRADVLRRAGGFAAQFGRLVPADGAAKTKLNIGSGTCDDTEFCIRAARLHPGGKWAYRPEARVRHVVPAQRATWRYFVSRCRMEGNAKAMLTDLTGTKDGLGSERRFVLTLFRAFLRNLGSSFTGQRGALARAAAICAGLGLTASAYLRTRLAGMAPRADARGARGAPIPSGTVSK